MFEYKTSNETLLENIVHYILDKYRVNSNREHFQCNLEYMQMIIEYVGKTIDTCKGTYDIITKDEFIEKLYFNLSLPIYSPSVPTIIHKNKDINITRCNEYVNKFIIQDDNSCIIWADLWKSFNKWTFNKYNITFNKKIVKNYFETKLFLCREMSIRHKGVVIRGWKRHKLIV